MAKIFVSHSSRDRELAAQLKQEIIRELDFDKDDVFVSTRPDAIEKGDWLTQIIKKLEEAEVIIPLITPCGIKSTWVAFEYAYFWDKDDKEIYPLYDPKVGLPSPLGKLHGKNVTDESELENHFKILRDRFAPNRKPSADLKSIVDKALKTPRTTTEEFQMQIEAKLMLKQAQSRDEKQIILDWLYELKILHSAWLNWIPNLEKVSFVNANLYKTDLGGNNLRGANFTKAVLEDAHLGKTQLQGADFTDAVLTGASFAEAELDENTILPNGEKYSDVREIWNQLRQAGVRAMPPIIGIDPYS